MSTAETAHEFGALNTLLLVVILGLCILAAYLIKQNSFYYFPESAAAIVVGAVVGGLAKLVYPSTEELHFLTFEPELFFFLLLPPIIFEAGYSLRKRDFFANFWSICLYAVFGTIISTFIIGFLVYWTGLSGLVAIDTTSPMEALVFGALISAVDPVATLSIMGNQELNVNKLLYSLVFGESVLNDAVSIVLFKTFMASYESGAEFSMNTILQIMGNFAVVSFGSVIVGIVAGLGCSYVCKHTQLQEYPEYEISILFLFAYGSYSFAESVELSGIMALFFSGITLSHYNSYNLSVTSQITAHNIFKSLAVISEYFVFLYIGMGIFTSTYKHVHFGFCALAMLYCLIGRVGNIFPLSWLANCFRKRVIPLNMQIVMWFSGLRGAIAFALSQNMPIEHRGVYVSTTLMIVIVTTIICGGMTEPMLSKMGMRNSSSLVSPTGSGEEGFDDTGDDSYEEVSESTEGERLESGRIGEDEEDEEEEEEGRSLRSSSNHSLASAGISSRQHQMRISNQTESGRGRGGGGRDAHVNYEQMKILDDEDSSPNPLYRNSEHLIQTVESSSHNSSGKHSTHHNHRRRKTSRTHSNRSGSNSSNLSHSNSFRKRSQNFLRMIERDYMTPLFGGPSRRSRGSQRDGDTEDDVDIHGPLVVQELADLTSSSHHPSTTGRRSRANSTH